MKKTKRQTPCTALLFPVVHHTVQIMFELLVTLSRLKSKTRKSACATRRPVMAIRFTFARTGVFFVQSLGAKCGFFCLNPGAYTV